MDTIQITADERYAYTQGECDKLARFLHQKYGLPFVLVAETDLRFPQSQIMWHHALVALPDGTYLDIDGVHDADAVLQRWSGDGRSLYVVDPADFASLLDLHEHSISGLDDPDSEGYAAMEELADRVLQVYGVQLP